MIWACRVILPGNDVLKVHLSDVLAVIGMPDYVEPGSDRAWKMIRARFDLKNNASLPTSSASTRRGRSQ